MFFGQHFSRDVAGKRAGRLRVAILCADAYGRVLREFGECENQGRRRADEKVHLPGKLRRAGDDRLQLAGRGF